MPATRSSASVRGARVPASPLVALATVLLPLLLSGCSQFALHGLAFRDEQVVRITWPRHRARVHAPFDLRWRRVRAPPAGARYEVLVDRSPQPPGEAPAWLARGDDTCRAALGCPDSSWYAARGVYFTSSDTMTIPFVASTRAERSSTLHDAIVVVVDRDGRRIGESAALVEFRIVREPNGIVENG